MSTCLFHRSLLRLVAPGLHLCVSAAIKLASPLPLLTPLRAARRATSAATPPSPAAPRRADAPF